MEEVESSNLSRSTKPFKHWLYEEAAVRYIDLLKAEGAATGDWAEQIETAQLLHDRAVFALRDHRGSAHQDAV